MQIEVSASIDAAPHIVFGVMTGVERWPHFLRGIERVELLTPGPLAVGSRFRETRKMYGREAAEEMSVALLDPPRRMDLTAENHGARYLAIHDLQAEGNGTRLTLRFGATPLTFAARIFSMIGFLFVGSIRRQLQQDLDDVKAEAERRARG
jgi:hypothetical protein